MPTLTAKFDGRAFVPSNPVDLPVGTEVEVLLPPAPLREPTPEENDEWRQIRGEILQGPPEFPTVDEAMKRSRKRP